MKSLELSKFLSKFQHAWREQIFPHAWLLIGHDTAAKLECVNHFTCWLFCSSHDKADTACGNCKSCNLLAAGTHPDFLNTTPSADKNSISVDEIRALNDFVSARPQLATHKIVILSHAEQLNNNAANALLKSLEEPSGNTLFFLLTRHQALLLPTILSRVVQVNFAAAADQEPIESQVLLQMLDDLYAWLQKSLTVNEIVEAWIKRWPEEVLYFFELVLADLLLFKYTQDINMLKNTKEYANHVVLNNMLSPSKLWCMTERIQQAQYWLGTSHNPNKQLLLESIVLAN